MENGRIEGTQWQKAMVRDSWVERSRHRKVSNMGKQRTGVVAKAIKLVSTLLNGSCVEHR